MWQHDMEQFARRWRAFGWHAIVIDGHDMNAILDALAEARRDQGPADDDPGADDQGQGRVVRRRQGRLARQGVQEGRGARPRARRARGAVRAGGRPRRRPRARRFRSRPPRPRAVDTPKPVAPPAYKLGEEVATREAYGTALAKLGEADPRVVALDADVKNSTFSDKFEKVCARSLLPELHRRAGDGRRGDGARGARRDSVSVDVRLLPDARRRLHPHGGHQQRRHQDGRARTPACRSARTARRRWRSRTSRCAAPSRTSPCSIRATPSAPSGCVALMAYHPGPAYMRTSRPKTPVIYSNDETFAIGGLKVLRESAQRRRDGRRRRRDGVRGAQGVRSAEGRRARRFA